MEETHRHESFIRREWQRLAALAWNGYRTQGRGAVVVDMALVPEQELGVSGLMVPTHYLAEGSTLLRIWGGWPCVGIAQAVSNYDPETEVVFVALGAETEFSYYRFKDIDGVAPVEAARAAERLAAKDLTHSYHK